MGPYTHKAVSKSQPTLCSEEGAPGALRLLREVCPEHGRCQDQARGLLVCGDADLVLRYGCVELPEEGVRQVCPTVDTSVIADELLAGHLFLHLHIPDEAPLHSA